MQASNFYPFPALTLNLLWQYLTRISSLPGSIHKRCCAHPEGNWFFRQIWKLQQRSLCHWDWIRCKAQVSEKAEADRIFRWENEKWKVFKYRLTHKMRLKFLADLFIPLDARFIWAVPKTLKFVDCYNYSNTSKWFAVRALWFLTF